MTIEGIWFLVSITVGMMLGCAYFGGLWFTIQRLPTAKYPTILVLSSLILRLGVTVFGFFLIMAGHWDRLMFGLLGFLFMRFLLVRHWGIRNRRLAWHS